MKSDLGKIIFSYHYGYLQQQKANFQGYFYSIVASVCVVFWTSTMPIVITKLSNIMNLPTFQQ